MSSARLIALSIFVGCMVVAFAIIYAVDSRQPLAPVGNQPPANNLVPTTPTSVPNASSPRDVIMGDIAAPIIIIEYGDYQCPFCSQFHAQVGTLLREHYIKSKKAKMVFRNFQFLGQESIAAAQAAECSKDQSKFWSYHDALYTEELLDGKENNGNLNRETLLRLANQEKLDVSVFSQCLDSNVHFAQIQADTLDAQTKYGINSTPTVFINGKKVEGSLSFAALQAQLDMILGV